MNVHKIGFLSIISLLCLLPHDTIAVRQYIIRRSDLDVPYVPGGVPKAKVVPKEENDPAVTAALLDYRDKLAAEKEELSNEILEKRVYHRHSRITPGCSSCEKIQVLKGKEEVLKRFLQAADEAQKINSRNHRFHLLAAEVY